MTFQQLETSSPLISLSSNRLCCRKKSLFNTRITHDVEKNARWSGIDRYIPRQFPEYFRRSCDVYAGMDDIDLPEKSKIFVFFLGRPVIVFPQNKHSRAQTVRAHRKCICESG